MLRGKFKSLLIATCLLPPAAGPAGAEILIEKSNNVRIVPNFWYKPMERSDDTLLAFVEASAVTLPDGAFPVQALNRWDDLEAVAGLAVKDAVVDSHMLYFHKENSKERRAITAEIEFDGPVIGLIADCRLFERDAALFAPDPTHKQAVVRRKDGEIILWSLEQKASWTPLDRVTLLSETRIRIEFTNHSATDALRVLTLRSGTANRPYPVTPDPEKAAPTPAKKDLSEPPTGQ